MIETSRNHNEADTIAALALSSSQPHKNPDPEGRSYVIVPEGHEVRELPRWQFPARKAGNVALHDAASFVRFFGDHSTVNSRIYADENRALFTAVINDQPTKQSVVIDAGDWRDHRATFQLVTSTQVDAWVRHNERRMSQGEFAEFVEAQLLDIVQPVGAELLEMALNFHAMSHGTFQSSQRLHDGSSNLVFRADTQQVGQVKLPAEFTLSLPIFRNCGNETMLARLRYRVADGGKLSIWYSLVNPEEVTRRAFAQVCESVKATVGDVVLRGAA